MPSAQRQTILSYRRARRGHHSQLRQLIHSPDVDRWFYYAARSRPTPPPYDEARNGNGRADQLASRHRRARNGIVARLSLHHHQPVGRRRFAKIPAYHGRGTLFEPAPYPEVIGDLSWKEIQNAEAKERAREKSCAFVRPRNQLCSEARDQSPPTK